MKPQPGSNAGEDTEQNCLIDNAVTVPGERCSGEFYKTVRYRDHNVESWAGHVLPHLSHYTDHEFDLIIFFPKMTVLSSRTAGAFNRVRRRTNAIGISAGSRFVTGLCRVATSELKRNARLFRYYWMDMDR